MKASWLIQLLNLIMRFGLPHSTMVYCVLKNNQLISKKDILPKQVQINTLKSDGEFLWISTDEGFYRFQPKTNQIKSLNTQDGLTLSVDKFIILEDIFGCNFPKFILFNA